MREQAGDGEMPEAVRDRARKAYAFEVEKSGFHATVDALRYAEAAAEVAYSAGRADALRRVGEVASEHRERARVLLADGHPEPAYDRGVMASAIEAAVEHVESIGEHLGS